MSEKLLEADFLTVNLNSIYNNPTSQSTSEETATEENSSEAAAGISEKTKNLPTPHDWNAWAKEREQRLIDNKSSANKKPEYEVESDFFKDFFMVNWPEDVAKQLLSLGEPLRKAIKVMGFNPKLEAGGNPLLAFVLQEYVQEQLLKTKLLNVITFKPIYNAIAKKLVAHSEFFKQNTYNIIYCQNLYRKSATEMEEYLSLQKEILKFSASEYTGAIKEHNKKVFLVIDSISELDTVKRASIINKPETLATASVVGATLNSIKLAKQIHGKTSSETVSISKAKQVELVTKLASIEEKLAVLMSLSMSSDSVKAKEALSLSMFTEVSAVKLIAAFQKLAGSGLLPKGKLTKDDADALVVKILASRSKN